MKYQAAVRKFRLELIGMYPFVLLGRLYGKLFPLKEKRSVFLFYPSADIGGAIQVNADIACCIKDKKPLVIFSKRPKNNGFRHLFNIDGVGIIDLSSRIDHKAYHFINFFYRGVLATWINKADNPVVFGGEGLFFYKILPHINKGIPCIELCHLDTWLPYSIGLIDRIDVRICSTKKLMEAMLQQYRDNQLSETYDKKVCFIDNKIDIPPYEEVHNPQLEIVFIGRGAPQKRVYLISAIAERIRTAGLPAHFSFVGDVERVIDPQAYPYCTFYGNVTDDALMKQIYRQSDVLILTSAFEGLPLVVMQMMAHGKVVLSTAVNGIPDYIRHMENGLLITVTEEDKIIEQGVELIRLLIERPELKFELGKHNREVARQKFGEEQFCQAYRSILLNSQTC